MDVSVETTDYTTWLKIREEKKKIKLGEETCAFLIVSKQNNLKNKPFVVCFMLIL